ncbi:MAG: hypothetical protein H0V64_11770 [Geodermatophilaceae bacterium]|jgi:hypothetical protein|nr:hypothetical protein [Geodermatophilaceae bacterium]MDQ3464782.1 hypothetical protein [Actinomycetota bacterium]
MSPSPEPNSDLIEPEGVNAASSDQEPDSDGAAHVSSSTESPRGAKRPEDAATDGDLLGPPVQGADGPGGTDGPGQELAAGEG